ncbi:UNVERIFIED_CONTAM: hypothetical protein Sangu_1520600 [Sesamum angustifolium]|uniref:Uncharacterized protein n=1 Tax=Sesamum angustifolium TaxID=2727405 RepID=A0AAW2MQ65_9LAMI
MLKRRSLLGFASNIDSVSRFRDSRGCFMAAPSSSFIGGQRDLQMFSLRRLSSNASTSSAVDNFSTRRFLSNGFRLKGSCSENYGSILRNNNDFKNDRCNSNVLQKAKEYGPWLPQLLRVSEEVIGVKDQLKRSVNAEGDANRGSSNGVLNQFLSQKIMVAVDVDEGI